MKKYLNISLIYAIVAMVGGVFYRELNTPWKELSNAQSYWQLFKNSFMLSACTFGGDMRRYL